MPTNQTQEQRDAELASMAREQFAPAYSLGVRHAARIFADAFANSETAARQNAGMCFQCGDGTNPRYTMRHLNDYLSYNDSADTILPILSDLVNTYAAPTYRDFVSVSVEAINDYETTAPRETLTVQFCQPCADSVMATIVSLGDTNPYRRGECEVCAAAISSETLGTVVGASALGRSILRMRGDVSTSYSPRSVMFGNQGEPVTFSAVYGSQMATRRSGNARRYLCDEHTATHRACYECGTLGNVASVSAGCRQCLGSNVFLCAGCAEVHADHYSPRDFVHSVTIDNQIRALAATAIPGSIIRSTRTLGQEVETGARYNQAMPNARPLQEVDRAIFEATGHGVIANIGTDGSISLDHAYEIRGLPVAGINAEHYVDSMAYALAEGNWSHNLSTGAHIHVGVSDSDFWRVYVGQVVTQAIPIALSDSRRFNGGTTYCRAIRSAEVSQILGDATRYDGMTYNDIRYATNVRCFGERYVTVNATAFDGHRTIEIRTPSGDVPHDAIRNMHLFAWLAGLSDYAATDEGFAAICANGDPVDSAEALPTIVGLVADRGHIGADTAAYVIAALADGVEIADLIDGDTGESESYCGNCECDCDDCYCEEQECGSCGCGESCDHDGDLYANDGSRYCSSCDGWVAYI